MKRNLVKYLLQLLDEHAAPMLLFLLLVGLGIRRIRFAGRISGLL